MPAERNKSVNMDEKDVCSFLNKEKDKDRETERRPASSREKSKDETKACAKKTTAKPRKRNGDVGRG
uniref:Uncharacterized protein n=1 Tax=Anguilla anguilla TaxID=7936 RepID=A0A0E9UKR9_ANGAN